MKIRSFSRTIRRIVAMSIAVVVAAIVVAAPAGAHAGDQSYLYLDVSDLELAGRIEFPLLRHRDGVRHRLRRRGQR